MKEFQGFTILFTRKRTTSFCKCTSSSL